MASCEDSTIAASRRRGSSRSSWFNDMLHTVASSFRRGRQIRSGPRADRLELDEGGGRFGVLADILGDPHRAELRAAHAAERRGLEGVLGEGLVVHPASGLGIE